MKAAKLICAALVALLLLFCAAALSETVPDGVYAPDEFSFSGGTGRVTITCPSVTVADGVATATIVFSSPHYTTATLDGATYEAGHADDSSTFALPVPLNRPFEIAAVTTAMSQPHEIRYTLYIRLGEAGDGGVPGLVREGSLELYCAEGFSVDYYAGGYALIDIAEGDRFLVVPEGMPVPEGLDPALIVLQKPLEDVYLAATSAMALVDRLGALDSVGFSSQRAEDWHVEHAADAMRAGEILYAGKYSEPDYELLVREGCDLAVESTMILHAPKVRELLELLGIPVLVDRSSYEPHPLGRTEWIKLYAVLFDREAEAAAFFETQRALVESLSKYEPSGKSVAFFYIGTDGLAVVRGANDYVARMIELGGGTYVFSDMDEPERGRASVSISMEDFYAAAVDADYLIYNTAIDATVDSLEDLAARNPMLSDLRAVREGHVFRTGHDFYQATDIVAMLIEDVHDMLEGREDGMTFLEKLR